MATPSNLSFIFSFSIFPAKITVIIIAVIEAGSAILTSMPVKAINKNKYEYAFNPPLKVAILVFSLNNLIVVDKFLLATIYTSKKRDIPKLRYNA